MDFAEGDYAANPAPDLLNSGDWLSAGETRYLYDGMLAVQDRDGSNFSTLTYTRGPDLSGTFGGAEGIGGLLGRSHDSSIRI